MRVSDVQVGTHDGQAELSATIDGERVWYRFPGGIRLQPRGDTFLAAALIPAMAARETLEIDRDAPVSPRLLKGVMELQDIFSAWYPNLRKIEIRARTDAPQPGVPRIGSFFSGGVDGSYTFLKNRDAITDLLFVKGIDMQLTNDSLFYEAVTNNREAVEAHGKNLVTGITNVRFFIHRYPGMDWNIGHGGGLASIALATGFSQVFIASTHTYNELLPWGSHPITDHLWSSEATEIVHDGAEARRTEKLRKVASDPNLLSILRVCWQDEGYNCGKCDKCLRTMATLRAFHLNAPTFPPLTDLKPLRNLAIYDENELSFVRDNLQAAEASQDRPLRDALAGCIARYERKEVLKAIDRVLFGGGIRKLLSKLRGK